MNYIKYFLIVLTLLIQTVSAQSVDNPKITYFHNDITGTPIAASDEEGNIIWREERRAYGKIKVDPLKPKTLEEFSVGFTGHQADRESGLIYAKARYYNPGIGRFYAPDPIPFRESDLTSINRYAYAANNPYRFFDPMGTDKWLITQKYDNTISNAEAKIIAGAVGIVLSPVAVLEAYHKDGLNAGMVVDAIPYGALLHKAKKVVTTATKHADDAKLLAKRCCFVAGTQVLTEDGYKNIEEVELGEKLWAKSVETGESDWKPVTKIWREPNRGIYEIKLVNRDGDIQTIEATDDHPFYVLGKGWRKTIELAVDDEIETKETGTVTVISVTNEHRTDLTYNFTVADFHTYYVTKQNIFVHNCGDEASKLTRSAHSKLRSTQGRSVAQAYSDLQNARAADIFVQTDGRFIIRGPRGREHIIEAHGELVTTINNRSNKAHLNRVGKDRFKASEEEVAKVKSFLNGD